jgi:hypothetical protein
MKSKYFKIHELVPLHIYEKYGERAWQFIDDRVVLTLDFMKSRYKKKITVNNYFWGGVRHWSGLRTPASPYYSETSQHSSGRAIDCLIEGMTAEDVRKDILRNAHLFPYIKALEMEVSWVHFDVRNSDEIVLFNQ